MISLTRLRELRARQAELRETFRTELARCVAEPPHGYATCQLRFDRLQEKLDDIDRELRDLGGHLRVVEDSPQPK